MAEVDVRKQGTERSSGGELQRRGSYPSLFSLSPAEFFSTNPFSLMRRFTNEMAHLFESYAPGWQGEKGSAFWSPPVEVRERDGKLEVVADLPGLKENDVKVEVTDEGLVIQGERKHEHEQKREGYYRSERSYGRFYRLIPLPEGAQVDQAKAEFRNGELRVVVPIPERQRKTRQIPITSGAERMEAASQPAQTQQARRAG